jgi:hypothetical protein
MESYPSDDFRKNTTARDRIDDLGERVFNLDAEVFLTGVEVFGPHALGAGLLGGGDDHGVVKMEAVGLMGGDGAEHGF